MNNNDDVEMENPRLAVKRERESDEGNSSRSISPTRDLLNRVKNLTVSDRIAKNAYLLCRPGGNPEVLNREQYIGRYGEPTVATFKEWSLLINAGFLDKDPNSYFPPPVFAQRIPIPSELEDDIQARSKYRAGEFKRITGLINVPCQSYRGGVKDELTDDEKVQLTPGGKRSQQAIYRDPRLAGALNPDYIVTLEGDVIDAGWRRRGDKFTGKTVAEVEEAYGKGAKLILKSSTHAYSSTDMLRAYGSDEADKRFCAYVGERFNKSLNPVVYVTDGHYICVKHILDKYENTEAAIRLKSGDAWRNVRVASSTGNAWIPPEYAMTKAPEQTKRLLAEAGLPESIANPRIRAYQEAQKLGDTLPAVAVPLHSSRHGPPENGEVLSKYTKEQIMIASRDKHGERTGNAKSLSSYESSREMLPSDAANVLGIAPDTYLRSEQPVQRARYDERTRGKASMGR
ncbi:VirE2 family protein [Ensifer aridi]|uniref:VirE2 family protein n=1 Tax=Ensifer aridi TaxID=1708715 RepID=UPI0015517C27|nr:VirE2 family protein [Ensifer aridi]